MKKLIAEAPLAVAALDEKGGRAEIPTAKLRVAVWQEVELGPDVTVARPAKGL
jgi:hypothetical protein